MSWNVLFMTLLLAAAVPADDVPDRDAQAEATTEAQTEAQSEEQAQEQEPEAEPKAPAEQEGPKRISGMSVLGNQEAPKSLVIVPWQSSRIGDSLGVSTLLDDSRQPVDREVFLRALSYYEIRSEKTP